MQSKYLRSVCCDAPIVLTEWAPGVDVVKCKQCRQVVGFKPLSLFESDAAFFRWTELYRQTLQTRLSRFIFRIDGV